MHRMWSGFRQSPAFQFLWRVSLLLKTVSILYSSRLSFHHLYLTVMICLKFPTISQDICSKCLLQQRSKASHTSWRCRYYCLQPRCSPTWLRPRNYYGFGRGTSDLIPMLNCSLPAILRNCLPVLHNSVLVKDLLQIFLPDLIRKLLISILLEFF